ncbi:uncharacterized protein G2W53_011977 [Senna tora]|uniref:DUF4408 domain-containing protein n=1 Tax=Senna tora TaxID=362788 RepID=A0A834TXA2_9FABA|nr:uncharacterized protein G2W53_011977 [Senna tora]
MVIECVSVEKARKRRVEKALGLFNLCVGLLILSRSSWLPIILQIFFHLYSKFVSLLNHPFYVFLLGNVIILFIYALSDKKDEFVHPRPVDCCDHKQREEAETTRTTTRTMTTTSSRRSSIKCYDGRVESESYSRRIVVAETSRQVVRYEAELERRLCSVDNLSNEDFNRTVEDFIAKHRRMRWQEHTQTQTQTHSLPHLTH